MTATLGDVIEATVARSSGPRSTKGHRGDKTGNPHDVFISGQKRGIVGVIKRQLRRADPLRLVLACLRMLLRLIQVALWRPLTVQMGSNLS
jgi:transposase, IS5 family